MEQQKRIPPAVGILFSILGIMHIWQGYRMENTPEIILMVVGCIMVVFATVINVQNFRNKIKSEKADN